MNSFENNENNGQEWSPLSEQPVIPPAEPQPVIPPAEPQPAEPSVEQPLPPVVAPTPPPVEVPPPAPQGYPSTAYHYTAGRPYDPYGWYRQPTPPPELTPPKKGKGSNAVLILLVVIGIVLLLGLGLIGVESATRDENGQGIFSRTFGMTAQTGNTQKQESLANPNGPVIDITEYEEDAGVLTTQSIIQKNLNCTVVITTYEQNSYYNYPGGNTNNQDAGLVEAGGATGIIWTEDGYIITNRHCVVNEETNIQYAQIDVRMYDGTVYEKAEVVGVDSDTDLAVIKIDAKGLPTAVFGDSSKLQLGDKVVALGNSGGLEWTPTQGIISGLARDVYDDTGYAIKCLQTDAAINPGNSGGPLINAQGQVIGINSAKIVASGYESLGFSIPINEAKSILDSLVKYGYVKGRVSLGITGKTYTSTNSNYDGFQIVTIGNGSALAGTKAEAGDIITHVNDVRVVDYAELRAQLSTHKVGDKVTLTLLHVNPYNRQVETIKVTCVLQESTGG